MTTLLFSEMLGTDELGYWESGLVEKILHNLLHYMSFMSSVM